ncbi:MAG: DUF4870 domain-containing protein [Ruminococcus sp.]|uniref:DUF4870 domain-containing protein n=1 Tax=Ruminococcus sp. TaxID=41978 RepID=UPI001B4471FC|nr:DUF4870 domain-containing protein [Ruminococcus sp.]MBP5578977.1 DUF4870 domain-containing protein [Ruminococcus sp.]
MENFLEAFNDINAQNSFNPNEPEKNKLFAKFAYIMPCLFFLPFLNDKDSAYCKFHSNQALTWFIIFCVLAVVGKIIGAIPVLGVILKIAIWLAIIAIWVSYIFGAVKEKAYRFPVVGDKINVF